MNEHSTRTESAGYSITFFYDTSIPGIPERMQKKELYEERHPPHTFILPRKKMHHKPGESEYTPLHYKNRPKIAVAKITPQNVSVDELYNIIETTVSSKEYKGLFPKAGMNLAVLVADKSWMTHIEGLKKHIPHFKEFAEHTYED